MYSRQQFTDLTYMGGTRPCGPVTIILGSVIWGQHTSLNIKFGVARTFHVLKAPVYRFDLYVPDPVYRHSPFSIPTSVWVIEAYVQIFKSVAHCVRTQSCLPQTDTRTDGQTDIAQMSQNFALIKCLQGSQIIISRCYKRIDKTNIPSLRRV